MLPEIGFAFRQSPCSENKMDTYRQNFEKVMPNQCGVELMNI